MFKHQWKISKLSYRWIRSQSHTYYLVFPHVFFKLHKTGSPGNVGKSGVQNKSVRSRTVYLVFSHGFSKLHKTGFSSKMSEKSEIRDGRQNLPEFRPQIEKVPVGGIRREYFSRTRNHISSPFEGNYFLGHENIHNFAKLTTECSISCRVDPFNENISRAALAPG